MRFSVAFEHIMLEPSKTYLLPYLHNGIRSCYPSWHGPSDRDNNAAECNY